LCNATFTPLLITSTSPIANAPGSDCLINTKRLGSIGTGKEQAALLHEGSFNAELLGFYQDGEMKKVGEETYFVSSTSTSTSAGASAKAKDTTHPDAHIPCDPALVLVFMAAFQL
jgi:hypothetical protein